MTTGVIGCVRLPEGESDEVLPHEETLAKARSDRLDLLRATRANLSPIWGCSPPERPVRQCSPRAATPPPGPTTTTGSSTSSGWIDDPEDCARSPPRWGRAPRDRRRPPPLPDRAPLPEPRRRGERGEDGDGRRMAQDWLRWHSMASSWRRIDHGVRRGALARPAASRADPPGPERPRQARGHPEAARARFDMVRAGTALGGRRGRPRDLTQPRAAPSRREPGS